MPAANQGGKNSGERRISPTASAWRREAAGGQPPAEKVTPRSPLPPILGVNPFGCRRYGQLHTAKSSFQTTCLQIRPAKQLTGDSPDNTCLSLLPLYDLPGNTGKNSGKTWTRAKNFESPVELQPLRITLPQGLEIFGKSSARKLYCPAGGSSPKTHSAKIARKSRPLAFSIARSRSMLVTVPPAWARV